MYSPYIGNIGDMTIRFLSCSIVVIGKNHVPAPWMGDGRCGGTVLHLDYAEIHLGWNLGGIGGGDGGALGSKGCVAPAVAWACPCPKHLWASKS